MNKKYPFLKILILYPLLAGLFSALVFFPIYISLWVNEGFMSAVRGIFLMAVMTTAVAFFPAFFTALVIIKHKVKRDVEAGYLLSVGFFTTASLGFLLCFMQSILNWLDNPNKAVFWDKLANDSLTLLMMIVILFLIGGVASVIIGKLILPQP